MRSLAYPFVSLLLAALILFQPPLPVAHRTIPGTPLTIHVAEDGSYQVESATARRGQLYFPGQALADAGFFIHAGGYALGPDFLHHPVSSANLYDLWSSTAQNPLAGSGTTSDPWVITTTLTHTPTMLTLTARTSYINSQQTMRLEAEVCTSSEINGSLFLAGDMSFDDFVVNDLGTGIFDASTGAVGGRSATGNWTQTLAPLSSSQASASFAGPAPDLWAALGEAGAPGPGLPQTITTTPVDLAAGLQWDFTGPGCTPVVASWAFAPYNSPPDSPAIWLPVVLN